MVTSAGALSMEYDIAGHMTSRGDAGMVWDYMGRLAEAPGANGKAASYAYGVAEERVAKVEDGSLTLYGYGDFQIRDGVAVTYVRLKRQFVARHETPGFGASFYPDADGDGSITAGDAYAAGSGGAVSQRAILMASAARALSEREEIPVPFGCYAGHCAACMVRVDTTTEGAANLPAPTVFETYTLTREELDAGWRLGCQLELGSGALRIEPWAPGLE